MTISTPTLTAPSTPILFAEGSFGPDDPRPPFARAVTLAAAVIDRVRPEHLDRPTPCDEFDVRGLLQHIGAVLPRVASIGRGESIDGPVLVDQDVADDQWGAVWRAGAAEVEAVWADDAVLAQTIVLPWVTERGAAVLDGYTSEVSVHTWDLAQAIGVAPDWDDEALRRALAAISAVLPAGGRTEMFERMLADVPPAFRPAPPFAEAVEVPDDAPMIDKLVAWNGRRP